jgi:hypothetical protein
MSGGITLSFNQAVQNPSKDISSKNMETKGIKLRKPVSIRLLSMVGIFIERKLAGVVMGLLEKVM